MQNLPHVLKIECVSSTETLSCSYNKWLAEIEVIRAHEVKLSTCTEQFWPLLIQRTLDLLDCQAFLLCFLSLTVQEVERRWNGSTSGLCLVHSNSGLCLVHSNSGLCLVHKSERLHWSSPQCTWYLVTTRVIFQGFVERFSCKASGCAVFMVHAKDLVFPQENSKLRSHPPLSQ